MKFNIRLLYLYLFSLIGLLITVFGAIRIIQLAIKVYVFKGADQYNVYPVAPITSPDGKTVTQTQAQLDEQKAANNLETQRQREREVAEATAMLIVGIPLYKYHWNIIKKEDKTKTKSKNA